MASVSIRPDFPHIVIVSGADVFQPNTIAGLTPQVLQAFPSSPENPVHRGTHDFYILNPLPSLDGMSFFIGSSDTSQPRKLRGVVKIDPVPSALSEPMIVTYLATLLQEVGHYWLVPGNLKIKVNGTPDRMATDVELTQAVNDESSFPHLPLIGRSNNHWSAYWQSSGSPMDGLCYITAASEDGYDAWRTTNGCSKPIALDASVPAVNLNGYCDLDLFIMGLMPASEAYRGTNGIIWMQPRLTEFVESRAGLVLIFKQNDQLLFGFDQHDSILGLRNSSGQLLNGSPIFPKYHPLGHDLNGIDLRVIRRRNQYYFQAKIDNPAGGCLLAVLSALGLYGGALRGIWDGVDSPGPINFNTDFRNWKTVAVMQHNGPPIAVGVTVNKWRHPHLCDAAFYRFELKQGANEWSITTDTVPAPMVRGDYASLITGTVLREDTDGAIFRVKGPQLHIIAPFSRVVDGALDHLPNEQFQHLLKADGTLVDNSPKVLTAAPIGDFAFATHAKLHRTIVTPWAGGYAANKEVWGRTSRAAAADVVLGSDTIGRQDVPVNSTYRMAFVAVVPDAATISQEALQRLDTMRRFWEVAFSSATLGRRAADTSL